MAREMVPRRWSLKVCLTLAAIALAPVATADASCRMAVLGDSLTSAYGLAVEQGFPARVEELFDQARSGHAVSGVVSPPAEPLPGVAPSTP